MRPLDHRALSGIAFCVVLSLPLSAAAQGQCPTAPPPACPPSFGDPPSAEHLLAEVTEAADGVRRELEARAGVNTPSARRRRRERRGPAEPLRPVALGDASVAFVDAGTRFACLFPSHPEAVTVRYRVARVHYEANRFAEAAEGFRAIAMEHPSHFLAEYAANLYLDTLNVMATNVPEPQAACVTELRAAVDPLWSRFCATTADVERHVDVCTVLSHLRCDGLRLAAEALSRAGHHRESAEAFARIAREHASCGRLDELLFNAAREYDAARLVTDAIAARTTLIEQFPESALALRARFQIGASFQALAQVREAAAQYVEIARRYPGSSRAGCTDEETESGSCVDARELLREAVFLYAGLGEREATRGASELYERLYGRDRERAAEVAFSWPRMLTEADGWPAVRRAWQSWLRRYGSSGRADQMIEALVALGRASAALGEHERAEEQYAEVLSRWAGGALLGGRDTPAGSEPAARVRRAVAEAMLRRTDRRASALLASRRPSAGELSTLEADLNAIAALEVPAWSIAAAARLAELELHAAEASSGDVGRHHLARAIGHAEHCAQTAILARWPSEEALACIALASRLVPDRFPPFDELVPAWTAPPARGVEPAPAGGEASTRLAAP